MTAGVRFRYRDESGKEHELASVEALSETIAAGRLTPDTSLFDAGTGQWGRAGDLPVFQFVVDELRREGSLPEEFDAAAAAPPDPLPPAQPDAGGEERSGETPGAEEYVEEFPEEELELEGKGTPITPDLEELPLTPDPFEMHLPRTSMGPAETDSETDAGEVEKGEDGSGDGVDSSSLHEWMLSQSKGGPGGREGGGVETEEASPPDLPLPPDDDRPPRRLKGIEPLASEASTPETPSRPRDPGEPARPEPDPSDWDTGALHEEEAESREIRSRPPPPRRDGRSRRRSRLRDRRRGMVVGLIVGGSVVVLIAILVLTPGGSDPADLVQGPVSTAPGTPAPSLDLPPFPLPDGSPGWDEDPGAPPEGEGAVPALALQERVAVELEALMDSVRAEMGLDVIPPAGWLGGRYLSGASRFTEVSGFWQDYSAFVERLASEDEALYREAAARAWEAVAEGDPDTPSGPGTFLAAIDQRYALIGEARQVRYERRLAVARAAGELHLFLVEREGEIEYAPALGGGVSADPVLEAVPMNQQVRRELELHLDRLFQALDQTRHGGVPSLGGLRSELFNQLREPV